MKSRIMMSVLALLLLLIAAGSANSQQKLQLEPCRLPNWDEDVRCGKYEVFENRQAKAGRKIALKIVVLPALNEKKEPDPVFFFSGGPGGSASETITHANKLYLANLRRARDLVFVDQRGTGGSNQLACTLYPDKNDMAAYFSDVLPIERLRACVADLQKNADLTLYSTPTAMDDLDDVRAAFGAEKINLYGGSYGTTAALSYLRQYPQRVRTVTLLGVAPPDMKLPLPVIRGVQKSVEQVFAYCAADPGCHQAYPNPREDLEKIFQQLAQGPVTFEALNPAIGQPQQITLTRPVFNELVRTMLYTPQTFRWLPLVLHEAAAGDFGIFASIGYQSFRVIEDQIARGMHFSVVCGEDLPFINDADVTLETRESFYGDQRLQAYRKVCAFWPRAQVPTSFATPVKASAPVLLISGEADPVAPPWLAADAAKQLPNGRHIVIPNTGHYFNFPCVDKLVTDFVNRGDARGLDASCLAEVKAPPFVTGEMLAAMAGRNRNDEKKPEGDEQIWSGVLSAGGQNLKLILHLFKAADGKLTANLDSPDQGDVKGLPIDVVTLKDSALHFEMHLLSATFDGKLNSDGTEVSGEWRQNGLSLPLVFKRTAK